MMEKLKRDKAEVVALMQKDKNEKVEETVVAKEMELQEALTKKARETEAFLQAKEEEMRAKYNEKVLYCMLSVLRTVAGNRMIFLRSLWIHGKIRS